MPRAFIGNDRQFCEGKSLVYAANESGNRYSPKNGAFSNVTKLPIVIRAKPGFITVYFDQ
ncbi:hypothetical protein PAJ34TS1_62870 [Paenibacillus azoreducens]